MPAAIRPPLCGRTRSALDDKHVRPVRKLAQDLKISESCLPRLIDQADVDGRQAGIAQRRAQGPPPSCGARTGSCVWSVICSLEPAAFFAWENVLS